MKARKIRDGVYWMGDSYILARMPYETDERPKTFKLGQDVVTDAIITHLNPDVMKVDVTGDKARHQRGQKNLFNVVTMMGPATRVLPQVITKEFKDIWVNHVRIGLQTGRLRFEEGRKDHVYTPRHEEKFKGAIKYNRRITAASIEEFMEVSFEVTGFDFLRSDFQKVYKKWIGPDKTTFDTPRDGAGHGDSFWAAVIGFSGIAAKQVYSEGREQSKPVQDAYVEPSYMDYF